MDNLLRRNAWGWRRSFGLGMSWIAIGALLSDFGVDKAQQWGFFGPIPQELGPVGPVPQIVAGAWKTFFTTGKAVTEDIVPGGGNVDYWFQADQALTELGSDLRNLAPLKFND